MAPLPSALCSWLFDFSSGFHPLIKDVQGFICENVSQDKQHKTENHSFIDLKTATYFRHVTPSVILSLFVRKKNPESDRK